MLKNVNAMNESQKQIICLRIESVKLRVNHSLVGQRTRNLQSLGPEIQAKTVDFKTPFKSSFHPFLVI